MATAGALVGASVAGLAYKLSGQNYTITFALATIPATLALLLTISVSIPSLQPYLFLKSGLTICFCRFLRVLCCKSSQIECCCRHLETQPRLLAPQRRLPEVGVPRPNGDLSAN
jgi:hypothetical protein